MEDPLKETTAFFLVAPISILRGVAFRYCLSLKAQKKGFGVLRNERVPVNGLVRV